jgi:hypothetical protein
MKFRALLQSAGKTATGIEVPPKIVEALGTSKRPPVRVTINGHTYRSTIAVMGGKFMVGVSAENRQAAGVAAGDELEITIENDTEPRKVAVPPDFAAALQLNPAAKQVFDKLSYSHKLQHVLAIEQAKTAETRERRIAKAVGMLLEGAR